MDTDRHRQTQTNEFEMANKRQLDRRAFVFYLLSSFLVVVIELIYVVYQGSESATVDCSSVKKAVYERIISVDFV